MNWFTSAQDFFFKFVLLGKKTNIKKAPDGGADLVYNNQTQKVKKRKIDYKQCPSQRNTKKKNVLSLHKKFQDQEKEEEKVDLFNLLNIQMPCDIMFVSLDKELNA